MKWMTKHICLMTISMSNIRLYRAQEWRKSYGGYRYSRRRRKRFIRESAIILVGIAGVLLLTGLILWAMRITT